MHVRWSRVAIFYVLALAGIGAIGLVLHFGGVGPGIGMSLLSGLAMFSPMVATLVMHRLDGRSVFDGLATIAVNRWIGVAMGLPILTALGTIVASALMPGANLDLTMMGFLDQYASMLGPEELADAKAQIQSIPGGALGLVALSIPQAVIAGATLNALFAFGEEVGWRGWLYRELEPLGFWRANLLIGALWGFWHAPLILNGHNYPVHQVAGVFLFTAVCMAMSPLFGWIRERGGSVWHAAIMHGVLNASAGLPMMLVVGSDLMVGVPGLAGFLVFSVLNLALFVGLRAGPSVERAP